MRNLSLLVIGLALVASVSPVSAQNRDQIPSQAMLRAGIAVDMAPGMQVLNSGEGPLVVGPTGQIISTLGGRFGIAGSSMAGSTDTSVDQLSGVRRAYPGNTGTTWMGPMTIVHRQAIMQPTMLTKKQITTNGIISQVSGVFIWESLDPKAVAEANRRSGISATGNRYW